MLTTKCNLTCPHCHCSAGPKGESINVEDAKRVLDHLPRKTDISITGGEIFEDPDLLYSVLEHAKVVPNIRLYGLMTNGLWAKDHNQMKKTISRLRDYGVWSLEITSEDQWHKEFPDDDTRKKLAKECRDKKIDFLFRGSKSPARSVGRARKIKNQDKLRTRASCYIKHFGKDINIDNKGNVSPCCYNIPRMPGNLITTPLNEIFNSTFQDPFFQDLVDGRRANIRIGHYRVLGLGPTEFENQILTFADKLGFTEEDIEKARQRGICELCAQLFERYNKERGIE